MSNIDKCKTWSDLLKKIIDIPIKKFPNEAYNDKEVKEIVTTMRKRMDEVKEAKSNSPDADDPYDTDSDDYRNMYDTFQHMADQRGIVID